MRMRLPLAGAFLAAAFVPTARADLLVNGSLETSARVNYLGMIYMTTRVNSHALPGWTITSGTANLVDDGVWNPADGRFSVELAGTRGAGSIRQTVDTVAGNSYGVDFSLAFDAIITPPFSRYPVVRTLEVKALGTDGTTVLASETFSGSPAGIARDVMHYSAKTMDFTADGAQATIVFSLLRPRSDHPGFDFINHQTGPVIDGVSVIDKGGGEPNVPEPASLAILGIGSLALLRRRR